MSEKLLSRPPEELIRRVEKIHHMPRVADVIRPLLAAHWAFTKRHPEFWIDKKQQETLPKGAFVAAVKHAHDDDIIATSILLDGRNPQVPGKIELFDNPFQAAAFKMLGCVPLIRPEDSPDGSTNWDDEVKPKLGKHLQSGEPVFIFPEGKRYRSPDVNKLHRGAADLAATYRVPLVPVGCANTHIKGAPIAMWIGEPIHFPDGQDDTLRGMMSMHAELRRALPEANAMAYQFLAAQTNQDVEELISSARV
jgi:1-acyl-sn-glycerol-3-phosphate acyltransferase